MKVKFKDLFLKLELKAIIPKLITYIILHFPSIFTVKRKEVISKIMNIF